MLGLIVGCDAEDQILRSSKPNVQNNYEEQELYQSSAAGAI